MGLATDACRHATAPPGVKTSSHRLLLRPTRTARAGVGTSFLHASGTLWALRESDATDIRNLSKRRVFWVGYFEFEGLID